MMDKITLWGTS